MKKLIYFVMAVVAGGMIVSCGSRGKEFEESEETTAEIEAAMMEGRESAKIFINRKWNDTTQLQNNLLEARSRRARYDTVNKPRCAAAYDSAFISTIRTVNPSVAAHIK